MSDVKPPSLVRKLASVMGACERVPKTGFNKFHNYAYATESDITAGVRAEMAIQGVMMIPTVEAVEWSEVLTGSGKKERLCTVNWLFTLLDADSEQKIEFRNIGQGQDSGDKAFYKAATGAVKYALLKLFLIPTGDDPEDASPDAGSSASDAKHAAAELEKVKADREAARLKLMAGLAAVGIDELTVSTILGHSPDKISNDEWTKLQKCGADAKAQLAKDPDEAARIEVSRQAEESLAKADAAKSSTPQTAEQMKRALADSLVRNTVQKLREATTEVDVMQIGAGFAEMKKNLTSGDMKAVERAYADRLLVIQDKTKEAKRSKDRGGDVP